MELEDTKDIVLLSTALERIKRPQPSANGAHERVSHELLVRSSDTNLKKTVRGDRLMQFFEDSFGTSKVPDVVYIETLAEIRARTHCEVVGVPNTDNSNQEMISFLLDRETGKTLARAYVSWASKALRDGK